MEHKNIPYLGVESGVTPMLGENSGGNFLVYYNLITESLSVRVFKNK